MKTLQFLFFIISLISFNSYSQNFRETLYIIDIQHYNLNIEVNDTTNRIDATAIISLKLKKKLTTIELDFSSTDSLQTGMNTTFVSENENLIAFNHKNDKLILLTDSLKVDSLYHFTIKYDGIPKEGLIIGTNKHGDRTFFGDNWPNRAHQWFPCIDHPSDKATVEYFVTAPNYYQVIANGIQLEETNLDNTKKLYHFKTLLPIPTKVMVIGIAKFAVQQINTINNIPFTSWMYPQTKNEGFYDFETTPEIVQFFTEKIGPYPFEKLASVQSSTRYGGMENAGSIFYYENSVTGKREHEDLIAHEIAHQWFGNSISEIDWPHLWLSEGFSTYFENLFMQHKFGEEAFQEIMKTEKAKVINFYKQQQTPVIDFKSTDLMSLLNPNSYEKGGWVLYMLHTTIGDEAFWNGIKTYYEKFKFKNAFSNDFKNIMASASGQNLDQFFTQWLEKPGHPILKISWISYQGKLGVIVDQTQELNFKFPLDIEINYDNGTSEIKTIEVMNQYEPHEIPTNGDVKSINLDPNNKLLAEFIEE